MNFLWLYELPTFWLGVLVTGTFVALSLGALWLTRPWMRRHGAAGNDLVNYYIASVGVLYAVLVGLIAVATWENYTDVQGDVANEAVAVASLYRDTAGYPAAVGIELREKLRLYVHYVIEEEWPDQRRGVEPTAHIPWLTGLVRAMATFEPATAGQQIVHAECLRQFNQFLTYRRLRLQAVNSGLPALMWLVVLAGAALTIGTTCFLWTDNLRLHSLLTGALAMIIGLVIFLILSLDRPLWGRVSVGPGDFQELLTTLMAETP